jgi:hypothetical protein
VTLAVSKRDPQPLASGVSPRQIVTLSVTSDDPTTPVYGLSVYFNGRLVVSGSESQAMDTEISADGGSGFDVVIRPVEPLAAGDTCHLRVVTGALDESWTFEIADRQCPVVVPTLTVPAPFSRAAASPASLTVVVSDEVTETVDFTIVSANLQYAPNLPLGPGSPANQVWFNPSLNPGLSFRGCEGRVLEVVPGVFRTIVSVQGPNLATYDGSQILNPSATVNVFRDWGLDIWVQGQQIVVNGRDAGVSGWLPVTSVVSGRATTVMTVPSAYAVGTRVEVVVRAADARGNPGVTRYHFDVGQAEGPIVSLISPAPGSRGVPRLSSPTSDLAFTVTSVHDVTLASVTVLVDGAPAVTAGVGVGTYAASTLTPVTGGFDVVLKNSVAYADRRLVHVDVRASDLSARAGERRVWSVQFGSGVEAAAADVAGGQLLSDDVVNALSFDFQGQSFADPVALGHTGFAADGWRYDNGSRTSDVASWFTELGSFPVSGTFVTYPGGWLILQPLATTPWMSCTQAVSGWSMAGNSARPLLDGDGGPDAVFSVASDSEVITIDFVSDTSRRLSTVGLEDGSGDITSRDMNQAGDIPDADYALAPGPYSSMSFRAWSRQWLLALTGTSVVTMAHDVDEVGLPGPVVSRTIPVAGFRVELSDRRLAVAYNDTGIGSVEVWDWRRFLALQASEFFADDGTVPALQASDVRDLVLDGDVLAVATAGHVALLNVSTADKVEFTQAQLGLTGAGSVNAVALESGTTLSRGRLYAGADTPGRVVAYQVHAPAAAAVLSDARRVRRLSSAGVTESDSSAYVRTAMTVWGLVERHVRTQMDVAP